MAEEQADRHAEQVGEGPEVAERRDRQAALDLADPADGAAELQGDLGQRQPARLAQRTNVAGQQPLAIVLFRPGSG